MIVLGWFFVSLAIALQILSIVLAVRQAFGLRGGSQILLVPCVLWYIGLVTRGGSEGFFAEQKGLEIGLVLLTHVVLSTLCWLLTKLTSARKLNGL